MRVRIHRGAREIGGSCVEVESSGERILLDLGLPLARSEQETSRLPGVEGLDPASDSLCGVLVSHGHPDHYGLLEQVPCDVPLYLGEACERMLSEARFFGAAPSLPRAAGYLADRVQQQIGPFLITPYLVDHSAFDAYAIVVEARGSKKRLLYSGDLRAHGRKPGTFERLLQDPPTRINALLLEGTRLNRDSTDEDPDERDVEATLLKLFEATEGLVLACYSPQNVDRYVGIYRAAVQSGRNLVIDLYTAAIAAATGRPKTIPQASWDRVRVFVPQSQRVRVLRSGEFRRVNEIHGSRIYADELLEQPERFVLSFRPSMTHEFPADRLVGAAAVWSMWPGYLKELRMSAFKQWLERAAIPLTRAHASGHARVSDLRRLAEAVDPDRVVPIHTEVPERYGELFDRIECHADGEWWEV